MEFVFELLEDLIFVYEEIFWLKECLTTAKSLIIFALVWFIVKLDHKEELLLYLATIIGVACIFLGDIGYLSDNDVLKLIAPATLFLLAYNKKRSNDLLLFIFLVPYFVTSYEFYRSFTYVIQSLGSHLLIIFIICIAKDNVYSSLIVSVIIGILINYIGYNSPPGTNDILVNTALITMIVKGIEFCTKNSRYTDFLKAFWTTLVCFAFFGSWIFHHINPLCPLHGNR